MEAWIFVHDPLERYLDDYHSIFDAWEAGGVRGLAVGYLRFTGDNGESLPTFRSDPAVYEAFGVEPPEEAASGSAASGPAAEGEEDVGGAGKGSDPWGRPTQGVRGALGD